jgi:hypothetical protein
MGKDAGEAGDSQNRTYRFHRRYFQEVDEEEFQIMTRHGRGMMLKEQENDVQIIEQLKPWEKAQAARRAKAAARRAEKDAGKNNQD